MSDISAVETSALPPPIITPEAPVRTEVWEVKSAEATRSPLEHETSPRSSEDRIIRSGPWAGVIDGAGGSLNGGLAADKIKGAIDIVTNGGSFTTKDSLGTDITINIPVGGEVFEGKSRMENQSRMMNLSTELNRLVRETKGGAACFAFGQIYEDSDGKLSLTYASLGDSEIAVVRKDGKVELMSNKSVRELAEKRNDLNLYLTEREAAWKYAEGQSTRELNESVDTGSVDLEEGDRVVYLTDGVAEDLHNIRGVADSKARILPKKGADGRYIGLDILGTKIDPKTPIDQMPQAILAELDKIRTDSLRSGANIKRNSSQYGRDVRRKIVNVGTVDEQINIIVGGKGPTTDRGYDDGETVVVAEAKKKAVETAVVNPLVSAEDSDEVYEDEPETDQEKALKTRIKNLKERGRITTGLTGEMLSIISGKRVYSLLRSQHYKAMMDVRMATTEEDKKAKGEKMNQLQNILSWAGDNANEVDRRIDQYKESDNPKHVAMATDLEMAINIQEIEDEREILRDLQSKLSTVPENEKAAVQKYIDQVMGSLANSKAEKDRLLDYRQSIKDDNNRVLPNQVEIAALEIIKVLDGKRVWTDDELEIFAENPLDSLNKHFSEMIGNSEMAGQNIKKLIDANLIKKENAAYFMNTFIKPAEPKAEKKSAASYILPTVGILAVLAFLMLQKAGAAEMGGGGGGGMRMH